MNVQLRDAHPDDASAMYTISCQTHLTDLYRRLIPSHEYERFHQTYQPNEDRRAQYVKKIHGFMNDTHCRLWVAEVKDTVVGFTMTTRDGNRWLLKGLFVAPEYQGHGIGRQLFRRSCEAAPPGVSIELTVIQGNAGAIKLYTQEGFIVVGPAETTFYGAPQQVMRRQSLT